MKKLICIIIPFCSYAMKSPDKSKPVEIQIIIPGAHKKEYISGDWTYDGKEIIMSVIPNEQSIHSHPHHYSYSLSTKKLISLSGTTISSQRIPIKLTSPHNEDVVIYDDCVTKDPLLKYVYRPYCYDQSGKSTQKTSKRRTRAFSSLGNLALEREDTQKIIALGESSFLNWSANGCFLGRITTSEKKALIYRVSRKLKTTLLEPLNAQIKKASWLSFNYTSTQMATLEGSTTKNCIRIFDIENQKECNRISWQQGTLFDTQLPQKILFSPTENMLFTTKKPFLRVTKKDSCYDTPRIFLWDLRTASASK